MKRLNGSRWLVCGVSVFFLMACGAIVTAAEDSSPAKNLVPNGSFEEASNDQPAGWRQQRWGGKGQHLYSEESHTGNKSVMISSTDGGDISWSITVPVRRFATYRLSGWIKTESVTPSTTSPHKGRGALFNLHNIQGVATPAVTGTQDWTRVDTVFETEDLDTVQINCLFGGWGLATGKAWFDDVELQLLSAEEWKPSIVIDAQQKGHPISKYIYGQFIEHLGRCIYGGIWAEMLEDRKFYYPVTAEYRPYGNARKDVLFPVVAASPWEIVGGNDTGEKNAVTMVQEGSFVGEHTPLVTAGSGIQQNDLAIKNGSLYEGYIWLKPAGDGTSATVTLSGTGNTVTFMNLAEGYQKYAFRFRALESSDHASLKVMIQGNDCLIGTVSLMPADNVHGMRADTLALLKELNAPVYRWPGGNFVSGYDWRDGLGDRDRRPPRKNPAWTGVEHNDFGLDEFMIFCRLLDTEPYIAVNSGKGQVDSAVQELQYANGAVTTPMGKWRAENGHPEPYRIKWWGIGNEMYGDWQIGHMPLEEYVKKHNEFAEAMRAEDSMIKLVAVGEAGPWSEGMMQHCAEHMDLISEHFYCQEKAGLAAHVRQIPDAVRYKADAHRDYRRRFESLQGKDIQIALDEWNYWYGPHPFGELGTRYFLKDALGIAAGLNEYARQSDIMFMANYAQTVNVIGCIKTTKTDAAFATTGLVLKLYREHLGTIPVKVAAQRPLDVIAALDDAGGILTIGIVNPTLTSLSLPLTLSGAEITGNGDRWEIAGDDPQAYNAPGEPPQVKIQHRELTGLQDQIEVAPCSVTLLKLSLK
jgi:alpha-N-arabinofuranosidase